MNYFNLNRSTNRSATTQEKTWPQWAALFLGVLVQPFFAYYREHGDIEWAMAYSSWAFLLFSLIVTVVLFPAVYRSTFDSQRPKIVQIIPIFTAGLGWETMLDSVVKGVGNAGNATEEATTELIQVIMCLA